METAPIALFAYRRPKHLQATLSALQANTLAAESALTIFCDGPARAEDQSLIEDVRTVAEQPWGFRRIEVIRREANLGLASSVIQGVSEMLAVHQRVIVLEDDLITSKHFLAFMNQALQLYEGDPEVWSLHGYQFPINQKLPDTFFLRGAECWGWATWRRAWLGFESDGQRLLDRLRAQRLSREFDLDGGYAYTRLLRAQVRGHVDSWAIRWRASAFVNNGLCLWPGRSLVRNIGHDATGRHCERTSRFDVETTDTPLPVYPIPLKEHPEARRALRSYLISSRPSLGYRWKRLVQRLASRRRRNLR